MSNKMEYLKTILTSVGGSVDDLPDNLETTILKYITEALSNSAGSSSGGGTKFYQHTLVSYLPSYGMEMARVTFISTSDTSFFYDTAENGVQTYGCVLKCYYSGNEVLLKRSSTSLANGIYDAMVTLPAATGPVSCYDMATIFQAGASGIEFYPDEIVEL